MSITQLITLLILLGGLAIFTIQNLTPSLPLMFLGNQLPTLPLSLWILIAIAAGIFTYWIIAQLFQFSNTNLKAKTAFEIPSPASPKPPVEPDQSSSWGYTSPPESPQSSVYNRYDAVSNSEPETSDDKGSGDDWETQVKPFNPSWDAEEKPSTSQPVSNRSNSPNAESKVYETEQKPESESWSGSVYSYGYRGDSNRTGVGKVETIYDADYRIITPPPATKIQDDINPKNNVSNNDDEDWGLDEDDENEFNRK